MTLSSFKDPEILDIPESELSEIIPISSEAVRADLKQFLGEKLSGNAFVYEFSYKNKQYYGGINNLSMYNEDFNIEYEYRYSIVLKDNFIDFVKTNKDKIKCYFKIGRKISDLERCNYKESPVLDISTKKARACFSKHYCFYFKANPNPVVLHYLGIHPNNVNNMSKRLIKRRYSYKQINEMGRYIVNNYSK